MRAGMKRFLLTALVGTLSAMPASAQVGTPLQALAISGGGGAPPPLLKLTITAPTDGVTVWPGVPVIFAATCMNALAFEWNFGDGSAIGSGGSTTHAFSTPGTYTVVAKGLNSGTGQEGGSSLSVHVIAQPVVGSFVASPASIPLGGSATLSWSVSNATTVALGGTTVAASGSQSVNPTTATAYTLTLTNAGGSITGTTTVSVETVGIAVSPAPVYLDLAQVLTFQATVADAVNTAVTWKTSGGTINPNTGTYSAPNAAGTFTVTATSSADSTKTASATVTVAPIGIMVSPGIVSLSSGGTASFISEVTGNPNNGVTWSATGGAIDVNTGAYTAPSVAGSYTITATSVANPLKKATATVTVGAASPHLTWKKDIFYIGGEEAAESDVNGFHYTQVDHLGSPEIVTNATGAVESWEKYLPFGETLDKTGSLTTAKGFTNHEQTDPSGLIYMQARFYAPMYGRFLSPDPARDQHFEETQSWNIYSYVQNSPTMQIDPTGMIGLGDAWNYAMDSGRALIGVGKGAGQAVWGAGKGLIHADLHPIETVKGLAHAVAHPVETAKTIGKGVSDAYSNANTPDQMGQFVGKALGNVGMALAPGAEAGNLGKAAEIGEAASGVEASGAASPFIDPAGVAGRSPGEIDQLAQDSGLIPKGADPMGGKGSYVDPVTGKQRVLIHPDGDPGPHAHINNPAGQRLDVQGNVVHPESPEAHLPLKKQGQ